MLEVRSMTYGEIADVLVIGQDSARNLVRRKRWNRKRGNDGLARIDVPVEYLDEAAITPKVDPTNGPASPPTHGATESAASDLALFVLTQHIERCEMEIESLKRELEAARSRASERDVAAAELATFSVVIGELRSERKHWRDQAERLSLALSKPPEPSRLSWLGIRFGWRPTKPSNTPDQRARSAREAAQDAGLLPSVTGTAPPIEEFRPISVCTAQATTSILDEEGPPLTASDLEQALKSLYKEMDDAHAARATLAA